jgi:hypothetical protein
MDRTPRTLPTPRTPGRRRLPRLLLAPALIAGLLAGSAWDAPAAHALAPGDPPSCEAFVQRYFNSGLPAGSTLDAFSLTTESITTEATYAETRKPGTGLSLQPTAPLAPRSLSGSATEYVSTRRFNTTGFDNPGDPFDPKATRPLEVRVSWSPLAADRGLGVQLMRGSSTYSVTPVGCLAANVLYGTVNSTLIPTTVVALSLGKLVPPPPIPN